MSMLGLRQAQHLRFFHFMTLEYIEDIDARENTFQLSRRENEVITSVDKYRRKCTLFHSLLIKYHGTSPAFIAPRRWFHHILPFVVAVI